LPFIAGKMAITLDGKFAAASGHSKWVTGESARADVMRWRRYFPAIAVSANTVLKDNPSLSSRIGDEVWCPQRFVFDRTLKTFEADTIPQIYTDTYAPKTTVLCADAASDCLRTRAKDLNIMLWQLPEAKGHLDWQAFRKRCVEAKIYGIYVEVGPTLATQVIEGALADYLFVYQAPKLLSDASAPGIGSLRNSQSMEEVFALRNLRQASFDGDRLIRGFLTK
jgi:diaminohydroxyphosphoribosylaminopyrimidine deaminase/5-amino-6-(5-phosphoribosylamino)uracil reductase